MRYAVLCLCAVLSGMLLRRWPSLFVVLGALLPLPLLLLLMLQARGLGGAHWCCHPQARATRTERAAATRAQPTKRRARRGAKRLSRDEGESDEDTLEETPEGRQ